jgi:hypothetical protein
MDKPPACWDTALAEYGDCDDHFSYGLAMWICTGPDEATCEAGGGVNVLEYLACNQYGCKDEDAALATDPWWMGGTLSGGGGSEGGGSFLPELSLEDGGLIAAAIAGIWALGLCLRLIRKQLEDS